ncbi:DoxX family protein [Pseudomonas sp. CCC3.2]|uniref:DoxX family protein n=1 Tax=unclassified Pseudomonas TaxID=196821 RepID=UPI002AB474DA|nr:MULTISPECIES: DoxX family protein [unclassified Pseudomonas]MDY7559662.1 DoxX family protein [Pseudomonas sp. AB6]MEA9977962.1 DoxX family protein [Pseudomonas sp. RTS4]MEB0178629.1 DoxX family protein [Pseudomonas sp. CCC3.2]MEB0195687.1 DoxX family protein [Pseudomonas sp. 5S4]MEB0212600.1 DoxX family protein [Pseudomonas sp. AB6]
MTDLSKRERTRSILRGVVAVFYFTAGIFHLYATDGFVGIVPDWVPYPHATVIFTGLCELIGAVALLTQRFRKLAGVMLALYAVCVFPANIKHAIDHLPINEMVLGWWYHGPRLAFQPVLVWVALFSGAVVDWPFRGRNEVDG